MAFNKGTSVGKSGEKAFEYLCSQADLICNESKEDKAGWDYFIQSELDAKLSGSLDKREPAFGAFVQVKSSLSEKNYVRIKLSNAERMITEPRPVFFAIYHFTNQKVVASLKLAHLGRAATSFILSTLRSVEHNKSKETHKRYINIPLLLMDISKIFTKEDLIDALRPFRDAGTAEYIKDKLHHRETTGYEKNAFSGSFSLPAETGTRDLISLLLEEIAEIEVSNLAIKEIRFGIEKEIVFAKQAKIKVEANSAQKMIVLCESKDRRLRSEIECDIIIPNFPGSEESEFRSLVKGRFLKFNIDGTKGINNWSFSPKYEEIFEWSELRNLISLTEICKEGNFDVICYLGGRIAASATAHKAKAPSKRRNDIIVAIKCLDELSKNISFRHAANISIRQFYESINRNRGVFYLVGEQNNIAIHVNIDSEPNRTHTKGILAYPFVMYGNIGFICTLLLISATTTITGKQVKATEISLSIGNVNVAESYNAAIELIRTSVDKIIRDNSDEDLLIAEESIITKKKKHLLSEFKS